MKTHLMLTDRTVKPWYSHGNVHVTGDGFLPDDTLISAEALARHLSGRNTSEVVSALQDLNGFFAYIARKDGAVTLAVDRVRSIPLFYGIKNDEVYVSDDAEYVRSNVGDTGLDEIAKQEFLLTGYVTGQDTLFPNVKQVQAGELIQIAPDENQKPVITSERWYRFLHDEPAEWDETTLREELNRQTIAAHKRLIQYAGGRQIVIPLSGGYDSRLIATMLKKLGYENIAAFSYGVPGNHESAMSKAIAAKLGIPWHFVEYSNELWSTWFASQERRNYYRVGSGWVSVAHMQDWPAMWELKHRGVLDPDGVIVPGHSGDFVAGSHLWGLETIGSDRINSGNLTDAVVKKHYCLRPWSHAVKALCDWNRRITDRAEYREISTPVELADAFEKWDWQERQAKFIVNSVRVYDFWGFDWWMPLWDAEFMRFWQGVPLELRLNKRWYAEYVQHEYLSLVGNELESDTSVTRGAGLKRFAKRILPRHLWFLLRRSRFLLSRLVSIKNRYKHPMAWYGWLHDPRLRSGLRDGYNINSFVAEDIAKLATDGVHQDEYVATR